MLVFLIILLVAVSGFLSQFERKKRFAFAKALGLVVVEAIIGCLLFSILIFLFLYTHFGLQLLDGVDTLFALVLFVALFNGIVLYWINRILIKKFSISNQVLTLCEYVIQWTLIYITIYQVIFDNLVSTIESMNLKSLTIEHLNISNPSDLIILILPSLISVWISIILYKVKTNQL